MMTLDDIKDQIDILFDTDEGTEVLSDLVQYIESNLEDF